MLTSETVLSTEARATLLHFAFTGLRPASRRSV